MWLIIYEEEGLCCNRKLIFPDNRNKGVGSNPTAVTSFVRMPEINFEFSEINDVFFIVPEQFKGEIINQD